MNGKQRKTEFFSREGQYFAVGGAELDQRLSVSIAIDVVRKYCAGVRRADECEDALLYLEDNMPKITEFSRAIRETYELDDFCDQEEKMERCGPALRGIWSRLACKTI